MVKRISVRLPDDLLERVRRKAAAEDRSLNSLIEDGLRSILATSRTARRVLPPISKATGGPLPGVNIADLSTLQELDDLDYVERMKTMSS
jgi:hypothetical protein